MYLLACLNNPETKYLANIDAHNPLLIRNIYLTYILKPVTSCALKIN